MSDPISVIEGLNIALSEHDLDAAADSLAEDVILKIEPTPPPPEKGILKGKQEVVDRLRHLMEENLTLSWRNFEVLDNTVRWISCFHSSYFGALGIEHAEAMNEASVEGNEIKTWTITFAPEVMERLRAGYAASTSEGY